MNIKRAVQCRFVSFLNTIPLSRFFRIWHWNRLHHKTTTYHSHNSNIYKQTKSIRTHTHIQSIGFPFPFRLPIWIISLKQNFSNLSFCLLKFKQYPKPFSFRRSHWLHHSRPTPPSTSTISLAKNVKHSVKYIQSYTSFNSYKWIVKWKTKNMNKTTIDLYTAPHSTHRIYIGVQYDTLNALRPRSQQLDTKRNLLMFK